MKPPSLFPTVRSMTPTNYPSLKMWVPNAPVVLCRMPNGHISATGDPIHFMFGSRVGFSGSADRIALFPVQSNPRWQPWHDMTWQKISTRAERCRLLPNYFGPCCHICCGDNVFISFLISFYCCMFSYNLSCTLWSGARVPRMRGAIANHMTW